jgi:hypothetical protein
VKSERYEVTQESGSDFESDDDGTLTYDNAMVLSLYVFYV